MQNFYLKGISKMLHPNISNSAIDITNKLGKCSYGLEKNAISESKGTDFFEITEQISDLLSPACGMTEEEKTAYQNEIMSKLKSGKKLTAEEMRFLQAENPTLYQQTARVQAMRASLQARLKSSSSKQEAQMLYNSSVSLVSDKDPMREYLIAAYDNVMEEFKNSDTYKALPTDDEN